MYVGQGLAPSNGITASGCHHVTAVEDIKRQLSAATILGVGLKHIWTVVVIPFGHIKEGTGTVRVVRNDHGLTGWSLAH